MLQKYLVPHIYSHLSLGPSSFKQESLWSFLRKNDPSFDEIIGTDKCFEQ